MRIAHLILAHKNPEQLKRLLKAIDHPQCDVYIHLDLKADENLFNHLAIDGHVYFIRNRVNVKWACYSLVQAQLNGMEEIYATGKYAYINVMSAQDFPIESPDNIYQFFVDHSGLEFMSTIQFADDVEWWTESLYRVESYHFQNWNIPGKYRLQSFVNQVLPKRKYPLNHTLVGRSQWFSITTGCARYILDFLKEHPAVVRYFKYVWGADEFIFSTIVFNSAFQTKTRGSLMYTDWSERKPNPKVLTTKDFETITHSGKFFARKFDMEVDANIFMMLEEWARGKNLVH